LIPFFLFISIIKSLCKHSLAV